MSGTRGDGVMSLADFLLARITEDETYAHDWLALRRGIGGSAFTSGDNEAWRESLHRLLAECEAKRRIVLMGAGKVDPVLRYEPDPVELRPVLQLLALPHSDHPDYLAEWRPVGDDDGD